MHGSLLPSEKFFKCFPSLESVYRGKSIYFGIRKKWFETTCGLVGKPLKHTVSDCFMYYISHGGCWSEFNGSFKLKHAAGLCIPSVYSSILQNQCQECCSCGAKGIAQNSCGLFYWYVLVENCFSYTAIFLLQRWQEL